MNSLNLNRAKAIKNDEFYTRMQDIVDEVSHYKNQFKNKIVYCNCDDPEKSNFWKYFKDNFLDLQLLKLVSTHIEPNKHSYKLEIMRGGVYRRFNN